MSVVVLLLLPLLAEGSFLSDIFCSLPDASTESLDITTANKTWYSNYQYLAPAGVSALTGCVIVKQSPGDSDNQMNVEMSTSKFPSSSVSGKATFEGNRYRIEIDGALGYVFNTPRNVVWSEEDVLIEHYCLAGMEMANILTTYKNPSEEVMERIWKIVDEHSEVKRSKFSKVDC